MNRAKNIIADLIRKKLSEPPSPQELLWLDTFKNSNEILWRLELASAVLFVVGERREIANRALKRDGRFMRHLREERGELIWK